jgi:pyruvate dehydrogenase E2 component (dihydrolipoamide acetyltransferase)
MRKVIAERMSYAKKNIPHLVLNARADATALIEIRNKLMDKILSSYKLKVTITDFILKISAIALRDNLKINSSLQDENYIIYEDVNVGFAVAVDEGLIVPTIYKCDRLDLLNIARKRIELVDKAKKGNLSLDEITNGTFTVTNLGMFGVRSFNAIINPPQAAILATGGIYADTAVIDGRIDIRSFLELSLSCDHRIVDGAIGARFLQKIVELIENPEMLFI